MFKHSSLEGLNSGKRDAGGGVPVPRSIGERIGSTFLQFVCKGTLAISAKLNASF